MYSASLLFWKLIPSTQDWKANEDCLFFSQIKYTSYQKVL